MALPSVIKGGVHVDARGVLRFCNDFDMTSVKRFYTISNSQTQPVRGWIGHRKETKWFFPIKGTTFITVESMSESAGANDSKRFNLSAAAPAVLKIPGGNWFCIEQHDEAEVMVFSDCLVGEYEKDDFRRAMI